MMARKFLLPRGVLLGPDALTPFESAYNSKCYLRYHPRPSPRKLRMSIRSTGHADGCRFCVPFVWDDYLISQMAASGGPRNSTGLNSGQLSIALR